RCLLCSVDRIARGARRNVEDDVRARRHGVRVLDVEARLDRPPEHIVPRIRRDRDCRTGRGVERCRAVTAENREGRWRWDPKHRVKQGEIARDRRTSVSTTYSGVYGPKRSASLPAQLLQSVEDEVEPELELVLAVRSRGHVLLTVLGEIGELRAQLLEEACRPLLEVLAVGG